MAAGRARPVINGDCGTRVTISVTSAGVTLRRLKVVGASEGFGSYPAEVDFNQVNTGRARGLVVRDTCDAQYGINVFDTGPVQIVNNRARGGFSDAGIYIGGIQDTLSVRSGESTGAGNDGGGQKGRGRKAALQELGEDSRGCALVHTSSRMHAGQMANRSFDLGRVGSEWLLLPAEILVEQCPRRRPDELRHRYAPRRKKTLRFPAELGGGWWQ